MYFVLAYIVLVSLGTAVGQQSQAEETACRSNEWRCSEGTCISSDEKCNGAVNCPDSSDETLDLCRETICDRDQFKCDYGACVDKFSICNDEKDCVDRSDERRTLCPDKTKCSSEHFRCELSDACIPGDWICDGVAHCTDDGTDETEALCSNKTCTEGQFRCAYGACVDASKICEGDLDCADGSDEMESLCKDRPCRHTDMFKCGYGACIYDIFLCDGTKQCRDGSDEASAICPNAPCKRSQFRCESDDKCLASSKVCNGNQDCDDGSDEYNCTNHTCNDDQFRCSYGACIPRSNVCNGQQDCTDGSDELYSQCKDNKCEPWQFRCAYGACITDGAQCNGHRGCADGSDELHSLCHNNTCTRQEFQCAYGPCVSVLRVCDGAQDCADYSDEQQPQCRFREGVYFKCADGSKTSLISSACDGDVDCADGSDESERVCAGYACHADQFRCDYGACLSSYWTKCDGSVQCADGSDETAELCKDNKCNEDQFRCAYGACIYRNRACDGPKDCMDGSDEVESLCGNTTCKDSEFRCAYGACISTDSVCDGRRDCVDGSDEILSLCQENTCDVEEFQCAYGACVSRWRVCDGDQECADNSDELQPQCQHIKGSYFTCEEGTRIEGSKLCDGIANCPDRSDETARVCGAVSCHAAQIRCAYGACLLNGTKCDGVKDCLDGHDESYELCGKVRCILPSYPDHGRYTVNNNPDVSAGDSLDTAALVIVCDEGFTVDTNDAVFCSRGRWSVDPFPKCVRYCTLPTDPSVAYRCISSDSPAEESRPCVERELSGAVALPSCNGPNYYSTQALPHMTCVNGSWDQIANCTTECGRVTPTGKKLIAGGRNAEHGELPWHTAIYRKAKRHEQICGGSLVSKNAIVSAAHCFWEYDILERKFLQQPAENYAVAVGKLFRRWSDNRDIDVQRSDVSKIVLPKEYEGQAKNFQADIAMVIVTTPFEYMTHIRPVCLSFDTEFDSAQLQDGNKGKIAGWGLAGANARESPRLKAVELPFVGTEECDRNSPQEFKEYITFDKFCAGFFSAGIAVCKGDSGGGLTFPEASLGVERYFLRGVVSTAPKDQDNNKCNINVYTTMTHVLQHQQFITQHL